MRRTGMDGCQGLASSIMLPTGRGGFGTRPSGTSEVWTDSALRDPPAGAEERDRSLQSQPARPRVHAVRMLRRRRARTGPYADMDGTTHSMLSEVERLAARGPRRVLPGHRAQPPGLRPGDVVGDAAQVVQKRRTARTSTAAGCPSTCLSRSGRPPHAPVGAMGARAAPLPGERVSRAGCAALLRPSGAGRGASRLGKRRRANDHDDAGSARGGRERSRDAKPTRGR